MYVPLDDIARLRINPELRYDHRVTHDAPRAVRLFAGNDSQPEFRGATPRWVRPDAIEHAVELKYADVVVRNRLLDGAFHVYSVDEADVGSLLSVHYTKIIPRDAQTSRAYLCVALRSALRPLAARWIVEHDTLTPLDLRSLRELKLYWPSARAQAEWVARYRDALEALRAQERAVAEIESALSIAPDAGA